MHFLPHFTAVGQIANELIRGRAEPAGVAFRFARALQQHPAIGAELRGMDKRVVQQLTTKELPGLLYEGRKADGLALSTVAGKVELAVIIDGRPWIPSTEVKALASLGHEAGRDGLHAAVGEFLVHIKDALG